MNESPVPNAWTTFVSRVLAPNPGPMTLDGTNSYIIRHPDSRTVVIVDPGPDDTRHREALTGDGNVELILLTHAHSDHAVGARALAQQTGAPVRAIDPALCIDADALSGGEAISAGGCVIDVLATPGHSLDSACFVVRHDGPATEGRREGTVLTGDTLLGRGSTVLAGGESALRDYLASLAALASLGSIAALPGHGEMMSDVAAACLRTAEHRWRRLDDVRTVLSASGRAPSIDDATVMFVIGELYDTLADQRRHAAMRSVHAQLAFLLASDRAAPTLCSSLQPPRHDSDPRQ